MMSVRLCTLAAVVLTRGCDGRPQPSEVMESPGTPPLVAVVPAELESLLGPVFAAWEKGAGASVFVVYRDGADAHGPGGDADLLVLADVEAATRAADDGLLRPLPETIAGAPVPARLRDPGGAWLALTWRPVVIAYDVRDPGANALVDYAGLGAAKLNGRTCLLSFALPGGEELLAELIRQHGVRPAERIVRGWLANLANPVFSSEAGLLEAISAGRCAAGMLVRPPDDAGDTRTVRYRTPAMPAGTLIAAGIARHANRPEAAGELLEWLAATAPLPDAARAVAETGLPAADAAVTGWLHEDARKLAERAGYR